MFGMENNENQFESRGERKPFGGRGDGKPRRDWNSRGHSFHGDRKPFRENSDFERPRRFENGERKPFRNFDGEIQNDGNSNHVVSMLDRIVDSTMTSGHVVLTESANRFAVLMEKIRSSGNSNLVASMTDRIVSSTMTNVHAALTENVSHFAVLMGKILKDANSSHVALINIDQIIDSRNRMNVPLTTRQSTRI